MYLAVVLDFFNREITGWSMRKRITKDIATEALTMAVKRKRSQKGLDIPFRAGKPVCKS